MKRVPRTLRRLLAPEHRLGVVALGVLTAAAIALVLMLAPAALVMTASAPDPEAGAQIASADRFEQAVDTYLSRIEGRSLFFEPDPPPRPRRVPLARPADPPPLSRPSSYGGPAIIAMVNGAVWFTDGQRLTPEQPEGRGIRLIALDPPWSARLEWQGVEFDVDLFRRTDLAALSAQRNPDPAPVPPADTRPLAPATPSPQQGLPNDQPPADPSTPPPPEPESPPDEPRRPEPAPPSAPASEPEPETPSDPDPEPEPAQDPE